MTKTMNVLDQLFYEIWSEGYIYDEDENGHNMSYGEYAAIAAEFEEAVLNQVRFCTDFEDAAETLKDTMNCTDDVRCFFNSEEYDNFDYYINDNGIVEMWSVPSTLKELFEELKEKYEEEHYIENEEEDEDMDMEF